MNKRLIISFLFLGIISIATQVIILREITVSFYGNEFFIGIVLAFWFFWVAFGSRLRPAKSLIKLYILVPIFFFLEIFLIRYCRNWLGLPGEAPNLIYAFILAFFLPTPLCLILGLWWTKTTKAFYANKAYFLEVLGFIIGGILITLFLFSSPSLGKIDKITAQYRFKGQELIETINSPYANIAVTKIKEQYNFYENGLLIGSSQETFFSEELIHLSLLQHPSPKKALLIGAGFNGILQEILKHPVEWVYYLELDPKLIQTVEKYVSLPAVEIINADARYFLNQSQEKFDVIIINLPDPSTILINKFYTQEFFQLIKQRLNQNGILATYLTYSSSTAGKNLENLNACIYKTLKSVFNQIIILPEETNLFLAADEPVLTYNPDILIQRFKQRNIKTKILNEQYIIYRLSNDRILKTVNSFEKNQKIKINKDFFPIAYFYQTLFWIEKFYLNLAGWLKNIISCFLIVIIGVLAILTFTVNKKTKPILSAAGAGFSLMALETIIIFTYQIVIGYLYLRIALLISALTAGMALGVWHANQKTKKITSFHFLLAGFCLILILIILRFANEATLLISSLIAGFLGGAIFPLANKNYLSQQLEPDKKTGLIYSADLFGSCLGTLIPALILIPFFGIFASLIFISIINIWLVLILKF